MKPDYLITVRDSALNQLIAELSNAKAYELAAAHQRGYTLGLSVGYLIGLLCGVALFLLTMFFSRRRFRWEEERLAR